MKLFVTLILASLPSLGVGQTCTYSFVKYRFGQCNPLFEDSVSDIVADSRCNAAPSNGGDGPGPFYSATCDSSGELLFFLSALCSNPDCSVCRDDNLYVDNNNGNGWDVSSGDCNTLNAFNSFKVIGTDTRAPSPFPSTAAPTPAPSPLPTTAAPTLAPTTTPPTTSPTTAPTSGPTAAPVTVEPTSSPSSSAPTIGPTADTTCLDINRASCPTLMATVPVSTSCDCYSFCGDAFDQCFGYDVEGIRLGFILTIGGGNNIIDVNCDFNLYVAGCTDEDRPPTESPTSSPVNDPTASPTSTPTSQAPASPTRSPVDEPTASPESLPRDGPSLAPSVDTNRLTDAPTSSATTWMFGLWSAMVGLGLAAFMY